jgi:hypothetical protein
MDVSYLGVAGYYDVLYLQQVSTSVWSVLCGCQGEVIGCHRNWRVSIDLWLVARYLFPGECCIKCMSVFCII